MSVIFDGGERHDDFNEELWRCCECGGWNHPDDGGFVSTARGPVCGHCNLDIERDAA